jgi:hypothetical protein
VVVVVSGFGEVVCPDVVVVLVVVVVGAGCVVEVVTVLS